MLTILWNYTKIFILGMSHHQRAKYLELDRHYNKAHTNDIFYVYLLRTYFKTT